MGFHQHSTDGAKFFHVYQIERILILLGGGRNKVCEKILPTNQIPKWTADTNVFDDLIRKARAIINS